MFSEKITPKRIITDMLRKALDAIANFTGPLSDLSQKRIIDLGTYTKKYYYYIFIVIIILAALFRFYHLERKTFHHDEALYAKYSYDYSKYGNHTYNPLMHGPFLFIVNGNIMRIFGASDYTARILPALCGLLMVVLCMFMHNELGHGGSIIAAIFFALSPHFVYYTRFLRMDPPFVFFTFLSVVLLVKYLYNKKLWIFVSAMISLAVTFSIKENAYLHTIEFISFIMLIPVYRIIIARDLTLHDLMKHCIDFIKKHWMSIIVGVFAFIFVFVLFYTTLFSLPSSAGGRNIFVRIASHVSYAAGCIKRAWTYWLNQNEIQRVRGEYHYFYWRMFMYEIMMVIGVLISIYQIFRSKKKELYVYLGITAFLFILFLIIGTNELPAYKIAGPYKNIQDFPDAMKSMSFIFLFLARMHMECWGHPILFIYITMTGFWGIFILFRERKWYPAFLLYWSMFSLLMYSYLGEKVAWLGIHIYLPMILLLAYYAK
ncbi:flippase activity-associated protein Agl23, partial [Spirochaetota bacterium]